MIARMVFVYQQTILAFLLLLLSAMTSKEQVQKHLSLSSDIKFTPNTPDKASQEARKARIMEHLQRSKGQR